MRKIILSLLVISICFSAQSDELKRENIIKTLMTQELGDLSLVRKDKSLFADSINDYPMDSVCLRHAVRQCNGIPGFIHNFASLISLFPNGTTNLVPQNLPTYKLDKYEFYATEMKNWLVQQIRLVELVDNYTPYKYRRVTEFYSKLNRDGEILKYIGVYYFDENDNLERYFWFDETKWNTARGMIAFALNHDFSMLEKILNTLGYKLNESLMVYLLGDEEQKFDRREIDKLITANETKINYSNSKNSTNNKRPSSTNKSHNKNSTTNNKSSSQSYTARNVKLDGPKYVVKADLCGATYNEAAMDQFTKYAINNNTTGIDYMIITGQLTVLKKGQVVTMVDLGIFISKVQLSSGAIVYTDTENLKKL